MTYARLNRFFRTPLIQETTVTVAPSGGDYTDVYTAVAAAVAASRYSRRYIVQIAAGVWPAIQMSLGAWVTVRGAGKTSTILVADGTSTAVDPVSGERYVDMLEADKHGFWIDGPCWIKDLRVLCNNAKYAIHGDSGFTGDITTTDCHLQHASGFPVGLGANGDQHYQFYNCTFKRLDTTSYGVFCHNAVAQAFPARLTLAGCVSDGCGLLYLREQDSGQPDVATINNCAVENSPNGIYFDAADPGFECSWSLRGVGNTGYVPLPVTTAANRGLCSVDVT